MFVRNLTQDCESNFFHKKKINKSLTYTPICLTEKNVSFQHFSKIMQPEEYVSGPSP
jgi:hypothetical protein